MSEAYDPDIITLCDDEGKEFSFEVLDAVETDDAKYVALLPVYQEAEELVEDSGELVVLRVIEEGDENFFEEIESDEEYNEIAGTFMERLKNIFEFEDDEETEE